MNSPINSRLKVTAKRCHVCGDVASAFNSNGLTCQSCKMFFRRNAPNFSYLKCKIENNCKIVKSTRKYCKKCRLNKCISIGMRFDRYNKDKTLKCHQALSFGPNIADAIFMNTAIDSNNNEITLRTILQNNNNYEIDGNFIADFGSLICQKSFYSNSFELTTIERQQIVTIQCAMQQFTNENCVQMIGNAFRLVDAFNLQANYARKIVKFCKNVEAFRGLRGADQLTLLKPFYYALNIVRMTFNWDYRRDATRLIADESGCQVIRMHFCPLFPSFGNLPKCLPDESDLHYNRAYRMRLQIAMENDPIIRDLLITQLLFQPHNSYVTCPEFVNYQYSLYNRLLRRYLEHKYRNHNQAELLVERKYAVLLNLLETFNLMRDNSLTILRELIDQEQIEPVLREAFEI